VDDWSDGFSGSCLSEDDCYKWQRRLEALQSEANRSTDDDIMDNDQANEKVHDSFSSSSDDSSIDEDDDEELARQEALAEQMDRLYGSKVKVDWYDEDEDDEDDDEELSLQDALAEQMDHLYGSKVKIDWYDEDSDDEDSDDDNEDEDEELARQEALVEQMDRLYGSQVEFDCSDAESQPLPQSPGKHVTFSEEPAEIFEYEGRTESEVLDCFWMGMELQQMAYQNRLEQQHEDARAQALF
jgi:hypothetical protein